LSGPTPSDRAEIVALLPPASASHVGHVVGHQSRIRFARSRSEFDSLLASTQRAAILIDPLFINDGVHAVRSLIRYFPPALILLYVRPSADSLKAVLELSWWRQYSLCASDLVSKQSVLQHSRKP
jgi:hypothetical protein